MGFPENLKSVPIPICQGYWLLNQPKSNPWHMTFLNSPKEPKHLQTNLFLVIWLLGCLFQRKKFNDTKKRSENQHRSTYD